MKIEKKCVSCKKRFFTYNCPSKNETGRGKYCSRKCQFESMIKRVKVYCVICNKKIIKCFSETFKGNKVGNEKIKRHFCSKECRIEGCKKFDYKRIVDYIKENKGYEKGKLGLKGKSKSFDGYYIFSNKKVHRLLIERKLGRKLLSSEIVHHKNGNKLDNELKNLEIVDRSEHNKIHRFFKSSRS